MLLIDEATECEHRMVMKDLCCDCGADLRKYVPSIKYYIVQTILLPEINPGCKQPVKMVSYRTKKIPTYSDLPIPLVCDILMGNTTI